MVELAITPCGELLTDPWYWVNLGDSHPTWPVFDESRYTITSNHNNHTCGSTASIHTNEYSYPQGTYRWLRLCPSCLRKAGFKW